MTRIVAIGVLVGVLVTAAGWGMLLLGGWGPCGPASPISYVGGMICGIGFLDVLPLPPFAALFLAAVFWSVVAGMALVPWKDR